MRQPLVTALLLFVIPAGLLAQSASSSTQTDAAALDQKGFAAYMQFGGSFNASGRVLKLDTAVGYNFNSHFAMDLGVPVYFAGSAATATTPSTSNNGLGNPYLDLRLSFAHPALTYRSVMTGYIPAADSKSGFSTGRFTADWTNHFERSFSRLTPFVDLGIGNTIIDTPLFARPFTSLGFNAHVQGGATLDLTSHVSVGASAYGIIPAGNQKIFSKLVSQGGMMNQQASHAAATGKRTFETTPQVSGTAGIARDHGFSAWIGASPNAYLDFELGYTRSVNYDLNTVSFNIGLNVGRLMRHKTRP